MEVVSPRLRAGAQLPQKPYYEPEEIFFSSCIRVEHYSSPRTGRVADLYDFYDQPEEEFERGDVRAPVFSLDNVGRFE